AAKLLMRRQLQLMPGLAAQQQLRGGQRHRGREAETADLALSAARLLQRRRQQRQPFFAVQRRQVQRQRAALRQRRHAAAVAPGGAVQRYLLPAERPGAVEVILLTGAAVEREAVKPALHLDAERQ